MTSSIIQSPDGATLSGEKSIVFTVYIMYFTVCLGFQSVNDVVLSIALSHFL